MESSVTFIRRNGRVIPIKKSGSQRLKSNERSVEYKASNGRSLKAVYTTEKTSYASRFKQGAKAGSIFGGITGGVYGIMAGAEEGLRRTGTKKGAAIGALAGGAFHGIGNALGWAGILGTTNSLVGDRHINKLKRVTAKGFKNKGK